MSISEVRKTSGIQFLSDFGKFTDTTFCQINVGINIATVNVSKKTSSTELPSNDSLFLVKFFQTTSLNPTEPENTARL